MGPSTSCKPEQPAQTQGAHSPSSSSPTKPPAPVRSSARIKKQHEAAELPKEVPYPDTAKANVQAKGKHAQISRGGKGGKIKDGAVGNKNRDRSSSPRRRSDSGVVVGTRTREYPKDRIHQSPESWGLSITDPKVVEAAQILMLLRYGYEANGATRTSASSSRKNIVVDDDSQATLSE